MISPRSEERKDWQFLDRSLQANIEDMLVFGGGGVFFSSVDVLSFLSFLRKRSGYLVGG